MKNLKDKLTTLCGILIAISGGVLTINQTTEPDFIPANIATIASVAGVIALSVLGFLTGKNPDGSTKSVQQVENQNQQSKP